MCFCFLNAQVPVWYFYPLIRALSPHSCFIPSCMFYPLVRVYFYWSADFYKSVQFVHMQRMLIWSAQIITWTQWYKMSKSRNNTPMKVIFNRKHLPVLAVVVFGVDVAFVLIDSTTKMRKLVMVYFIYF